VTERKLDEVMHLSVGVRRESGKADVVTESVGSGIPRLLTRERSRGKIRLRESALNGGATTGASWAMCDSI
jgi:hypothetical protein